MKKLFLILVLFSFFTSLFADPTLLIDLIHGVDFYTDGFGDQPLSLNIQDFEIIELTKDQVILDVELINETIIGQSNVSYVINLPNASELETLKTIYLIVDPVNYSFDGEGLGTITNPEGDIVAEIFNGLLHCDEASGPGWLLDLTLNSNYEYNIRIGYGNPIFATEGNPGIVDLNDYDAALRVLDETYFALEGDSDYYSSYEATAFQAAFENGFGFLNAYNYQDGMFAKPFVHFETEKDLEIDFEVSFPGLKTLAVPDAKVDIGRMEWNDFPVKADEFNELVYEASFQSKLNFIHFEVNESELTLQNQVPHNLDNIFVFKYLGVNSYRLFETSLLPANQKKSLTSYHDLTTKQLLNQIKANFMKTALDNGLSDAEADHFINEFIWIKTLLRRARNFPEDYFGFYHFNGELYNKLAPYNCSPDPSTVQRNAWVMLSNIVNRPAEPVVKFPEPVTRTTNNEEDFILREYGVADMYYSRSVPDREAVFNVQLGVYQGLDDLGEGIGFLNINDNEVGTTLSSFTETEFHIENGQYTFFVENPIENAIGYFYDPTQPTTVLSHSGENGKIISFGTAAFFSHEFGSEQFITNCANYVTGNPIVEVGTGQNEVPELGDVDLQIHPNPFNPSTVISLNLTTESSQDMEIEIYNTKGQKIKSFLITSSTLSPINSVTWNGTDNQNNQVASGIYLINLKVDDINITSKKCVLLK